MNDENFTNTWEKLQKHKRYENKAYLKWVKTQPCCNCGAPADDPHHIIGQGMGGMGMTAPDWATMPVCRGCHTELHNQSDVWNEQWRWIAETLGRAIEEGIL
jgi:hypothetical protein